MIPHRPPMRWIDAAAPQAYTVPPDHPFLRDGVLPRAALIELLAQCAACAAADHAARQGQTIGRGRLAALRNMKFHADVRTGDTLALQARPGATFGRLSQALVTVHVGTMLVAEGEMTFHVEVA